MKQKSSPCRGEERRGEERELGLLRNFPAIHLPFFLLLSPSPLRAMRLYISRLCAHILPKVPSLHSQNRAMATAIFSKSSKKFLNKTFRVVTFFRPTPTKSSNATLTETLSVSTTPQDDDRIQLDQEEETMRHVFDHFDVDKDGKISCEELMHYLASAGESVTHNGATRVIRDFDSDGDDLLEYGDFVRLVEHKNTDESSDDEVLRSAFAMFEVNKGCGCITPEGLQQMLRQLGDVKSHGECAAMIRVFDLDGNGSLDFHEFRQMMMSSSPS